MKDQPLHIILAEDEPALAMIVQESLESRGFQVSLAQNGEEAWEQYQKTKPDVLVLDVMMPKLDGFTLAQRIRDIDQTTPIIFLTAKSQTTDVVAGFGQGGNDYLKKPFSMEELIVRIKSLADRKSRQQQKAHITIGDYVFHRAQQELWHGKTVVHLTHRESELLYHLNEKRNQVLDRDVILNTLWGESDFFNARSMDVFITKLRKKLKKDPALKIINIRGVGYKLVC
ncbi:response regulator transcription factor [Sediminicola luteus]|uniref:DNA-binding response regulator n=1 Tax=Sediminicola luteus TaxID=319238 RepID=A0A2A4G4E7_9FLAO|nr:response regulator transcription factor [Sediminicola luteus]PCE63313.1 DNA-binding response regulator [Sediminicola luteus]